MICRLELYGDEELKVIVKRSAKILNIDIDDTKSIFHTLWFWEIPILLNYFIFSVVCRFDCYILHNTLLSANYNENALNDAVDTLINLGINKNEAYRLARSKATEDITAEEIILKVLKEIGR